MALKYKVKNLLRVATGGDNISQDRQQRDWSAVGRTHGLRIKYLPERQVKQVLKNFFSHVITISGAEDNKLTFTVKSVLN